jgi:hypothetical protein
MGQTLSEPVTNKETAICQDDNYKVSFFPLDESSVGAKIFGFRPNNCVVWKS